MKILIFYFSGTGNTKWVTEYFSACLNNRSYNVVLHEISTDTLSMDINDFDIIGIAHPIYGADMPPIVYHFLESNSQIKDKVQLIISTFGYVNAFGYFAEKKFFKNIKWYFNIKMFNNISTPKLKIRIIEPKKRISKKEKLKKKIESKLKFIITDKKHIDGIRPYIIPGIFIRRFFKNEIANHYKDFSVSKKLCKNCNICINQCPTESITIKDNNFIFSDTCTACMRCYNICPKNAILINKQFASSEEYPRYHNPFN